MWGAYVDGCEIHATHHPRKPPANTKQWSKPGFKVVRNGVRPSLGVDSLSILFNHLFKSRIRFPSVSEWQAAWNELKKVPRAGNVPWLPVGQPQVYSLTPSRTADPQSWVSHVVPYSCWKHLRYQNPPPGLKTKICVYIPRIARFRPEHIWVCNKNRGLDLNRKQNGCDFLLFSA